MKILVTVIPFDPIGGILNYVEVLMLGLKNLGHDVDFRVVPFDGNRKEYRGFSNVYHVSEEKGIGTGLVSNHAYPWQGAKHLRPDVIEDLDSMSKYDLIIHTTIRIPVQKGTVGKAYLFNMLRHSRKPQIGIAHEAGLPKAYPYIANLKRCLRGLICVHESTFNSAKGTGIPLAFIPNPHVIPATAREWDDFNYRDSYVFSSHYWKRWKNLNLVLKTMIELRGIMSMRCETAGDGIDMRYAAATDKCPPHLIGLKNEPLYQMAKKAGVNIGYHISHKEQMERMRHAAFFLEFGYSKEYNRWGAMFNRTIVEAMICGAIPVAFRESLVGSDLFKASENYIGVSIENRPADIADRIADLFFSPTDMIDMQYRNFKFVEQFNYRDIAERIVAVGTEESNETMQFDQDAVLLEEGRRKLQHFGVEL